MTTAALTDAEIEDRFFVTGPKQISALLGQFIYKSIPVTVNFGSEKDFILTTLLEARADELVFDFGGDVLVNQRLHNATHLTFVTSVSGIRVQFSTTGGVNIVRWGDADAFATRLPERVLRLQRRETYRIRMPVAHPIHGYLHYSESGQHHERDWPIHDLSVAGLCLTLPQSSIHLRSMEIESVGFTLPGFAKIDVRSALRHVTDMASGAHHHAHRLGIAFIDLPRSHEVAIQRYIIALERERHKLATDAL